MAHKGAVYDRTGSRCNCAAYLADGDSGGSSFVDWNTWTKPAARRVYSSDSTVMQGNGAARIAAEVIRRTPAITSGEEETMTDEKTNAEPSGASGGYPPTPPHHATVRERAVMEKFMRVTDDGDGFRCCLVGTPAMDIRFTQPHPTRDEADFCCYMLAKAIVFCGHEVCG